MTKRIRENSWGTTAHGRMTELQERFVAEYLIDLNATAAAIRAGYDPVVSARMANKMIKQDTITGMAIARAKAARAVRVGLNADRVLEVLGKIVNGDRRSVFREDGTLKAPHEFDTDDQALIEGVKTRRIVEIGSDGKMAQAEVQEVKLASLTPALTLAMRHLGMLNDKLEITHMTPLAQRLDEAIKNSGRPRLTSDGADVLDGEWEDVTGQGHVEMTQQEQDDAEMRRMLGMED